MTSYLGSNGRMVIVVMWVETLVALVFVLARMYTRTRLVRGLGWDDHLINISMVSQGFDPVGLSTKLT